MELNVFDHPPWASAFLAQLEHTGIMSRAAKEVGVSPYRVYKLRDESPEFAHNVEMALEVAFDRMEAEMGRRAFEGYEVPVYQGGELVGRVTKYSDGLAKFLMAGYRKRKFAKAQEITGADGGPVAVADETKRASRIAALLQLAKGRKDEAEHGDLA